MSKILVTGASGFLGRRLVKKLKSQGISPIETSLSMGLDLRDSGATLQFFNEIKPDIVLNCASFVGGIQYGYKYPVDLFENNLFMNVSLLRAVRESGVKRLVNPISNCVYPAQATLFKEEEIWNGPMHESVLVYGFVRKALWVGSWANARQYNLDIINIVLSNMYGPEDHFEEERSHALGALIMKFVEAEKRNDSHVDVWGSGKPVREWMHVDDGAEAMTRAMDIEATSDFVNVGIGSGISVIDMCKIIKEITGFKGEIKLDPSKPDGAPFKTVEGSKGEEMMNGWKPNKNFREGIAETVAWYRENF